MKELALSLLAMTLNITAAASDNTVIKGQVPRYEGKGYLLLIDNETRSYDTLQVEVDGSFTYTLTIKKPTVKGLYFEYLGDDRSVVDCYLIPGKNLEVNITGGYEDFRLGNEVKKYYRLKPAFKGATSKECDYLNISPFYNYYYTDAQGNAISYKEFLQQITNQQDRLRSSLKGTRKEFAAEKQKEIDAIKDGFRFVYARQLFNRGLDPSKDTDFRAFVDGIDVNDERNCLVYDNFDHSNLIADKIDYILHLDKSLYEGESYPVRMLSYLCNHVTNPIVRESISDRLMSSMMSTGGGKDLDKVWELYKQLSGSSETFKRNAEIYQSLSQLNAGTEATDFTMQDTEGNSVRFHDVIKCGKITYIDFWATWCGPCCAEIPYVEALVEHYKDNPRIQFVSISLDHNLDKWHEKLERDKPSWAQYIIPDNFNSKFAKEYNIRAIPRFMIFDGEGRIITIDAARPSNSNIKEILNEYIK